MALTDEQIERRMYFYKLGYVDSECAKQIGISISSFCKWRKSQSLPPNVKIGGVGARNRKYNNFRFERREDYDKCYYEV